MLAARHPRGDALGQVHFRRRGQPEDQAAAGGGDHRLLDLGMGVAEQRRSPRADVVDERRGRWRRARARRAAETTAIGSQRIAAKARTGEWTPPGVTRRARSNQVAAGAEGVRRHRCAGTAAAPRRPAERLGQLAGEIGDDDVGAGASQRQRRLHRGARQIHPAALGGGAEHGELARDLVGHDRHVDALADRADHVEVGQARLDHHHVGAFVDVGQGLADRPRGRWADPSGSRAGRRVCGVEPAASRNGP